MFNFIKWSMFAVFAVAVTACGGDDSSTSNNSNGGGTGGGDNTPVYPISCDAGNGSDIVGCWAESCRTLHDDANDSLDTYGYVVHSYRQSGGYEAMVRAYSDSSCANELTNLKVSVANASYSVVNLLMTDQNTWAFEVNFTSSGTTYFTILDWSTSMLCFPDDDLLLGADQLMGWVPLNLDSNDRGTSIPAVLSLNDHCLVRVSL